MKTIAIIHLGSIGDLINTSPVCIELKKKYPEAKLIYITIPISKDVASCLPGVQEVYIYDKRRKHHGLKIFNFAFLLESKKIDMVVILNESFRSALLAFLLGAKIRIGKDFESRGFLLTHKSPYLKEEQELQVHASEQYMRVLKPLGLYKPDYEMGYSFPDKDKIYIDNIIKESCYDNYDLIGFCPKSGQSFKDWNEDEAVKFVKYISESSNQRIIVTGRDDVKRFSQRLINEGITDFLDLTGKTTMGQLGAVISKCKKFVSMDSAPMHLACALKIPVLALFFQNNYKKWGPKDLNRNKLIYTSKEIKAEDIIEELKKLPEAEN